MPLAPYLLTLGRGLRVHKMLLLALLLGLILPWVVCVNVAEDVWEHGGFIGNERILALLQAHATPGPNRLALALTTASDPLPMGVREGWKAVPTTLAPFPGLVCAREGDLASGTDFLPFQIRVPYF